MAHKFEGFTLSYIIGVEIVEGVSRRSGSGLVHKVDQSSMVGREADATRPDLGILDRPLPLGLNLDPTGSNI